MRFALALHTDNGVTYGVTIPDLPGCFSAGDTKAEAIENAREAIYLHYAGMIEAGIDLPKPRQLAEHKADPLLVDAEWEFIDVDLGKAAALPR